MDYLQILARYKDKPAGWADLDELAQELAPHSAVADAINHRDMIAARNACTSMIKPLIPGERFMLMTDLKREQDNIRDMMVVGSLLLDLLEGMKGDT